MVRRDSLSPLLKAYRSALDAVIDVELIIEDEELPAEARSSARRIVAAGARAVGSRLVSVAELSEHGEQSSAAEVTKRGNK